MKKRTYVFSLLLAGLFVLAGCAEKNTAEAPQETEPEPPVIREQEPQTPPEETPQEITDTEQLKAEYEDIVAGLPRYDDYKGEVVKDGVAYANCLDLDGDGIEELMLLSVYMDDYDGGLSHNYYLEVYGKGAQGHATRLGEEICGWGDIGLAQKEDAIYLFCDSGNEDGGSFTSYGMSGGQLSIIDHAEYSLDEDMYSKLGSDTLWNQYLDQQTAEYDAVRQKYTEITLILFPDGSVPFIEDRGMLS